jgi:hypothetical protein
LKQEIPLHNPSKDSWNYKASLVGDPSFSCPNKLTIKSNSTATLPIACSAVKMGSFSAELTIINTTKEFTVIYQLNAVIAEPPAEEKIIVECQARKRTNRILPLKPSILKGPTISVTSTVPIITFPSEIQFANGEPVKPFQYTIFAQRSGISAGTLTLTDVGSKSYI